MKIPDTRSKQYGFTLIEMALVVLIMGLIVAGIFEYLKVQQVNYKTELTKARQQKVADALSSYAQVHFNLPCPSLPKPGGALIQGEPVAECATNKTDRYGIVPYRALGLTVKDIVDGWGNPFTYVVATKANKLSNPNAIPASPTDPNDQKGIEKACRMPPWFGSDGKNKNKPKAVFCCQKDDSLEIYRPIKGVSMQAIKMYKYSSDVGYAAADTAAGNEKDAQSISYFAYALISHGQNGRGAYLLCNDPSSPDCSTRRSPEPSSEPEKVNTPLNSNPPPAPNTIAIEDLDKSTAKDTYFDDIVLWRTQEGVMSELHNNSCGRP